MDVLSGENMSSVSIFRLFDPVVVQIDLVLYFNIKVPYIRSILYTERILIAGSVGTMNWKECPATLSAMLMIALTTFMKGISLVY